MKLAMIGVGQAGGKIVDKFIEYDDRIGARTVRTAVAVNTARADLQGLEYIPEDQRLLVGQSRVKGHGVGADNELGAEVIESDIQELEGAIDAVPVHEVDAFLVVAGLGGGTGSGGAPVIAKYLQRIYTEPVYALGILPGSDEGGIYTLNAARSMQTLVDEVDNLLLFDNDAWRQTGESLQGGYDQINEEIVRRFGILFTAGEVQPDGTVAESVVDASELINTLRGGGISTMGYAEQSIDPHDGKGGLLGRFRGDETGPDSTTATNLITSLVRQAARGRLTLPCNLQGTERALVVAVGPQAYLNRKGIERSRKWIEEETRSMEVRGGDYPYDGGFVGTAVLFSGVTDVPRIEQLKQVAVEAQETAEAIADEPADDLELLMGEDSDELDSLF